MLVSLRVIEQPEFTHGKERDRNLDLATINTTKSKDLGVLLPMLTLYFLLATAITAVARVDQTFSPHY